MPDITTLAVCGKTILKIGNIEWISAFGYLYVVTWDGNKVVSIT